MVDKASAKSELLTLAGGGAAAARALAELEHLQRAQAALEGASEEER